MAARLETTGGKPKAKRKVCRKKQISFFIVNELCAKLKAIKKRKFKQERA